MTFIPSDKENYLPAKTINYRQAAVKVKVLKEPENLKFKTASISISLDQTYKQEAIVDDGRKDITATYTSSKPRIAAVDDKGKVTPKKVGTTYITATTSNGLTATYKIVVKKTPTKVTLKSENLILAVGKTITLKPSVGKEFYTTFRYESSNNKVAIVSMDGKITAMRAGTTNITIKTHNGLTITCKITVK